MSGPSRNSRGKLSYVDPAAFTPHFSWKSRAANAHLQSVVCESVPLEEVADKVGTPAYLYSQAAIEDAYRELDRGLSSQPHTLCFAVKSNGNLSILKHLAKLGSGFDIVSGGELAELRRIGVRGDRIVFSGVGKLPEEIREALRYSPGRRGVRKGILLFNIESEAELEVLLDESARNIRRGGVAPAVAIRVNPDVQAGAHPHISTGTHHHKFGVDWTEAKRLYLAHRASKWIAWHGISAHIGSQITSLTPFRRALLRVAGYVRELRREGLTLRYLDFGGGLGVRYTNEKVPTRFAYAQMISKTLNGLDVHLLLEPGRSIIASAGVLLARVLYTKENRGKTFVVVDAAMNDMLRPALYGALHPITRVTRDRTEKLTARKQADVVGPVCETGDCFLHDWPLGEVKSGDLLAIWTAGAYGMSQASNYNARCRPAEVLVHGNRYRIIRRRETIKDLFRNNLLSQP
jgi:diaminopimelate decarboxylase